MRKELYSMKCPGRIVFGDPLYFEEYKGKRLADLVVDFKPPANFSARLALEEKELKEYPGLMDRTMTIYMAPEQTIATYADGYMYKGQETVEKEIGVDTAKYLIEVDGKSDEIHTGGDGYWGNCLEFYHNQNGRRILDAAIVNISIPEFLDFDDMKQQAAYFFEGLQPVSGQEEGQGQQMKME